MVLDSLKRKFLKVWTHSHGPAHLTLDQRYRRYQFFFLKLQDVILWDEPHESAIALGVVSVIFWILASCELRLFGVLFCIMLSFVCYELFIDHIWPEIRVKRTREVSPTPSPPLPIPPGRISLEEASEKLRTFRAAVSEKLVFFRTLREQQPFTYFLGVSAVCLLTAGVGSIFSGIGLLYTVTALTLTVPGVYKHLIDTSTKEAICLYLHLGLNFLMPSESSVNVDEFLPETNRENLALFAQAGEVRVDGSSSSLSPDFEGLKIPAHDESSMDTVDSMSLEPSALPSLDDEEDPLLPTSFNLRTIDLRGSRSSSTSSTSSPEQLSTDMNFPEIDEPTALVNAISKLAAGSLGLFGKSGKVPHQRLKEDSDSDFEMIEKEEMS